MFFIRYSFRIYFLGCFALVLLITKQVLYGLIYQTNDLSVSPVTPSGKRSVLLSYYLSPPSPIFLRIPCFFHNLFFSPLVLCRAIDHELVTTSVIATAEANSDDAGAGSSYSFVFHLIRSFSTDDRR